MKIIVLAPVIDSGIFNEDEDSFMMYLVSVLHFPAPKMKIPWSICLWVFIDFSDPFQCTSAMEVSK